jgi:glyceraldehyde 3-phosphate dehydrogenase
VNEAIRAAAAARPELIGFTEDPIVSSDVIGCRQSLLFDSRATLKAGKRIVKTLAWYESLGHACRVLDVVRRYARFGGES